MKSYPLPTVWFAGVVAASGLALFAWPGSSWMVLIVVEIALVAAFVVDALWCVAPSRIVVRREVAESVTMGESVPISWIIENHGRASCTITMTDALWPSLMATRRRVETRLEPQRRTRATATMQPSRRGRFPLDQVTVRTVGTLRLACRQGTRSLPGTLRVMPAYPSREEVQRRLRIPRVLEAGIRSIRTGGAGSEFDQLRDYRPDDEFKRIDWPATVRMQRPIVKQYRAERNQNVVLLLDNGRVMAGVVGGVPRVEHAMDAVLAVTQTASRIGDRVGLLTFDRQVRSIVVPTNGKAQLGRAAEAMFMLEPELAESAYLPAFSAATARFRRRSLYIVLTDLVEATVEEALLPALPILTRRHRVIVAGVQDPAVRGWADGGSATWPSDVFRQAAAVASLQQRARAVARLRGAGAVVVDAAPGQLGIELVDAYLALKASGTL